MTEQLTSFFVANGTRTHIEKNVYIYQPLQTEEVYLLKEGICALTSMTSDGQEKVFLYFRPTRIIGFNPLMGSDENRRRRQEFSLVSKTPCTLYRMHKSVFQHILYSDMNFNRLVIQTLSDNYSEALSHFHQMVNETATSRLCHLLLDLAGGFEGDNVIPKFFTYPELAKYLGTHPVTVSRIMTKLKKAGILEKNPEGLIIRDKKALQDLINSQSTLKY